MKSLHTYAKLQFPCTAEIIQEAINECMVKYGLQLGEILVSLKEDEYRQGHPMTIHFEFWMEESLHRKITWPIEEAVK